MYVFNVSHSIESDMRNGQFVYQTKGAHFYGYNRPGAKVSDGVREQFRLQGLMAGMPAGYFCIKAVSETDPTEDLKKLDVPTLIIHGDDDQILPIADSAMLSAKLVKGATLKVAGKGASLAPRPVEPGHLPGIFEPMKSGNHEEKDEQGTRSDFGFGLYIAREIVAAHGGSIGVTSIPEGTIFAVQLPRHNSGAAP